MHASKKKSKLSTFFQNDVTQVPDTQSQESQSILAPSKVIERRMSFSGSGSDSGHGNSSQFQSQSQYQSQIQDSFSLSYNSDVFNERREISSAPSTLASFMRRPSFSTAASSTMISSAPPGDNFTFKKPAPLSRSVMKERENYTKKIILHEKKLIEKLEKQLENEVSMLLYVYISMLTTFVLLFVLGPFQGNGKTNIGRSFFSRIETPSFGGSPKNGR